MRRHAFSGSFFAIALATLSLPNLAATGEDDFSALLGDLNFTNALSDAGADLADAVPDEIAVPNDVPVPDAPAAPPAATDALELPAEAALTNGPASIETAPQPETLPLTDGVPQPQPVSTNPYVVNDQGGYHDPAVDGCSTCENQCDSGRGCDKGCNDDYCQPYTQPALPSSTFYQYWRSNACNVNVWYGFKNRCHGANKHTMGQCDCFDEKKTLCGRGGCSSTCQVVESCDCGPAPAEWCNTCDGN